MVAHLAGGLCDCEIWDPLPHLVCVFDLVVDCCKIMMYDHTSKLRLLDSMMSTGQDWAEEHQVAKSSFINLENNGQIQL